MVIKCEIWAEKPFGFNDNINSQGSAARQGFKQLDIRLTMAVSVVAVCIPAACNPWLIFVKWDVWRGGDLRTYEPTCRVCVGLEVESGWCFVVSVQA